MKNPLSLLVTATLALGFFGLSSCGEPDPETSGGPDQKHSAKADQETTPEPDQVTGLEADQQAGLEPGEQANEPIQTPEEKLKSASTKALAALKKGDLEELSTLAHPEKGIRFTPYGYIDTEENVVLTATGIKNFLADHRSLSWGSDPAQGEPITLTFSEYLVQFVWPHDFTQAHKSAKNEFLGGGASIDNLKEVYPEAQFFEYHFTGFDPEFEGMDWESLRLVFEEHHDQWFLVGIIHDEWTP